MHGAAQQKAVVVGKHVDDLVDDVVMDAVMAVGAALSAVEAAGKGLHPNMNKIKSDAFLLKFFGYDLDGMIGDSAWILTAVQSEDFHSYLLGVAGLVLQSGFFFRYIRNTSRDNHCTNTFFSLSV